MYLSYLKRNKLFSLSINPKEFCCQMIKCHSLASVSLVIPVVSDSLRFHGPWPAWLLCPWDSPEYCNGLPLPSPVRKYEVSEVKLLSHERTNNCEA